MTPMHLQLVPQLRRCAVVAPLATHEVSDCGPVCACLHTLHYLCAILIHNIVAELLPEEPAVGPGQW